MKRHTFGQPALLDMTPMIDMTFQLIAFFMIAINFSDAEQVDRVTLPISELARPPKGHDQEYVVLHVDDQDDTIAYGGRYYQLIDLQPILQREVELLAKRNKRPRDAVVIIRGDRDAKTGLVQQVIEQCHKAEFEIFDLRAKKNR
jgi:biopolymer transport protein ExbD